MPKQIFVLTTAALIILALGGYFWIIQKRACPVENITISAYPAYAFPVYIAKEKGFFAANGLNVAIKSYASGREAMDEFLKGGADIATAADFVFVSDSFNHSNIRTIGTVTLSKTTHELIVQNDSGIKRISDIKGKKMGVTKKSSGEFYLGNLLVENGLTLKDVTLIDLKPQGIIEAFSKGEIEIALTWDPALYTIKNRLGSKIRTFPAQGSHNLYFLLISKAEFINQNPKTIEKFLASMIQAGKYIDKNNNDAKELIKRQFNLSDLYSEYIWPKFTTAVSLPQEMLLLFENQARWRILNNLSNAKISPNYLDFIYLDALEKVQPEAVTIIR